MTSTVADTPSLVRRSPMYEVTEHLNPVYKLVQGMLLPAHFGNPCGERDLARTLGLGDVSAFPRMGVKGSGVAAWVVSHGIDLPAKIYGHARIDDGRGTVIRTGSTELIIEDGAGGTTVEKLWSDPDSSLTGVYRFRRRDAVFYLCGQQAVDVFAQTCGYNFRKPDCDLVFTRVAGVSCGILTIDRFPFPVYQMWCDGSFGGYLWEQLHEICRELGGGAVGLEAFE